ncbi:hypothetical protein H5410_023331 [Solanum commersonii]|uniref:Uncharacterized protein n=1 Tax=Solanum commersonii TaxID=4109 RepID=A0A9J5ZH94_SOLCO|nr:hypothetical protein H5410_023331 [Solanum commersonii]
MLNDELNGMKINIPDDEIGHDVEEDQTPTPIVDIMYNQRYSVTPIHHTYTNSIENHQTQKKEVDK